jgi:hypothetical protein
MATSASHDPMIEMSVMFIYTLGRWDGRMDFGPNSFFFYLFFFSEYNAVQYNAGWKRQPRTWTRSYRRHKDKMD